MTSWTELKARPTLNARCKDCCGGAPLKIPGRPVISGVCAEQPLWFGERSVSNYRCVFVDVRTPSLMGAADLLLRSPFVMSSSFLLQRRKTHPGSSSVCDPSCFFPCFCGVWMQFHLIRTESWGENKLFY